MKKVVVGGTFDIIHNGHKALLKRAFLLGRVFIGLTSDAMVEKIKRREVQSFKKRKQNLVDFIKKEFGARAKISKIEDKFGFALKENFDYIVVSPETYKTAVLLNKERLLQNKKLIEIIKISFVLAKDGRPISSRRIVQNNIDKNGKII